MEEPAQKAVRVEVRGKAEPVTVWVLSDKDVSPAWSKEDEREWKRANQPSG